MKRFLRAQGSAIVATAIDFIVFLLLHKLLGVYYVYATAGGAVCGAISNFLINRYWAFEATEKPVGTQAIRYFIVAVGSMMLNVWGLYLLTEWSGLDPFYGKIIIALLVAWGFNYVLHRYWVFAKP